jgi:putative RecB family exonuclease
MILKQEFLPNKDNTSNLLSLSSSKIKTFKDCAAKYRFSYIEKLPRKEWHFHVFGKFCHKILEDFHQQIIEGNKDPYHFLMSNCFLSALKEYNVSEPQKREAWDICNNYLKKIQLDKNKGQLPTVLCVEKDFYININDQILLNGFIDVVQRDCDGVIHVADYKTSKSKKYLKKDFFQLLVYAYVICLEDPSIDRVRTSYIMLRHSFEAISKEFSRDEVLKMADKLLHHAGEINKEKLWRPSPNKLCGFCDFLSSCDSGRKFINEANLIKFGVSDWGD